MTGLPDDLPNAGMVEMLADVAQSLQASCTAVRTRLAEALPDGGPTRWWARLGEPAFPAPSAGQLGAAWPAFSADHGAQRLLVEAWHAEDLSGLGALAGQDPATNRRLRSWRRAHIAMHLKELCELHGLVLATSSPAYASWRDARDNTMGIAAEPVAAAQLRNKHSWARVRLDADVADAAQLRNDAGERARLLAAAVLDVAERLEGLLQSAGDGYVIVQRRVGRWFAPAGVHLGMVLSPHDIEAGRVPSGLRDADSNAAGNTAIRWLWGRVSNR